MKSVPISEAIKDNRAVDPQGTLVTTARGLGICLGDQFKGDGIVSRFPPRASLSQVFGETVSAASVINDAVADSLAEST